ncbi:MAG: hypothetical protein ACJZ5D_02480 [Candidatus Thalassarchaeaceae archaeon]
MNEQYAPNKSLTVALALIFIGMSLSMGFQPEIRPTLDDETRSMDTHGNLNFPGSTVGSIYSLTALGASYEYTCVVLDNNQMKCWGSNYGGFLGNSEGGWTSENEYSPVSVNDVDSTSCCLSDIIETSPDGRHTGALTSTGDIYAWGEDYSGQIGHGHISCGNVCEAPHGPSVMPGSRTFVSVATGIWHTCGITEPDMAVWCWGFNSDGQLGTGDNDDRNAPTQIELPQGRHAVSINTGYATSCAILDNGSGMCWGKNDLGHLGDGTYNNRNEPTPISILPDNRSLIAMDLGAGHACGILDDGMVNCWGNSTFCNGEDWTGCANTTSGGRLGDGTENSSNYPRTVALPAGRTAISIDAGTDHTCAILDDSSAVCWGLNEQGQLGDGTTTNSTTPVSVSMPSGLGVAEISAGGKHTCAVATNASVYCWGYHGDGSLGIGEDVDSDVPSYVDLGTGRHALMSERDNDDDGIVNLFDPYPEGCPIGYHATGGTCLEADPGYYADGIHPYEQFPCDPGTFQPSPGQSYCIDASPGNFAGDAASVEESPCEEGSYQPDSGQTSCILADPGNYVSEEGSIRQIQCSSGTYQDSSGGSTCMDASPGYFVTSFAAVEQTPCPPGSYQMLTAATSCFQAGPGFHVPTEGSDSQQQCNPGTYSAQQGQANCTEASPGFFVDGLQKTSQSPCQPGEFQPSPAQESCMDTDPGHYSDSEGSAEQKPCESGSFQPDSGQNSCILSDPGNYSVAGATSQSQCENGTYSSESGQPSCTPAEPGYFVDLDGAIGATPCPPGEFQSEAGSSGCESPPPGQVASPDGSSTSACPPGKYQPGGQSNCMEASPGNYVNQSGASSQTACEVGTFQTQAGQASCDLATPGNFVDSPGSTSQTPCSKGEFQSYGGQDSCLSAMPGNYVPEEGAVSQTTCKAGSYQPDEGAESCIPADPGSYVSSSAAISQNPCQPGTYQSTEGRVGCLPANPGNFVSETGATEQSACPSGTEQELSGQTGCIDIERPIWMSILMFGVPAVVLGTMAILYFSNKKKSEGDDNRKSYMYSEDLISK